MSGALLEHVSERVAEVAAFTAGPLAQDAETVPPVTSGRRRPHRRHNDGLALRPAPHAPAPHPAAPASTHPSGAAPRARRTSGDALTLTPSGDRLLRTDVEGVGRLERFPTMAASAARGGSSAGQSTGLIIPRSWVRAPPAPPIGMVREPRPAKKGVGRGPCAAFQVLAVYRSRTAAAGVRGVALDTIGVATFGRDLGCRRKGFVSRPGFRRWTKLSTAAVRRPDGSVSRAGGTAPHPDALLPLRRLARDDPRDDTVPMELPSG